MYQESEVRIRSEALVALAAQKDRTLVTSFPLLESAEEHENAAAESTPQAVGIDMSDPVKLMESLGAAAPSNDQDAPVAVDSVASGATTTSEPDNVQNAPAESTSDLDRLLGGDGDEESNDDGL